MVVIIMYFASTSSSCFSILDGVVGINIVGSHSTQVFSRLLPIAGNWDARRHEVAVERLRGIFLSSPFHSNCVR